MADTNNPWLTNAEVATPTDSRQSLVIPYEELQRMCDPTARARLARVIRWADRIGLNYAFDGRGGIFTTWPALHTAMGLSSTPETATLDPHLFG